ncbi:hypothetical protein D9613_009525 [Agrocybe pediades]|uniref:Transmembrane protein n=1 Tax=Agrocybe pediades TaxID=84607 RepID=A0A8H4R4H7_9AGAR|nr:hypothetical protein D9613_009525 [Agrocybe pediades]
MPDSASAYSQLPAPLQAVTDDISADVELTAEIVAVDPLARTLTMNWYPTLTDFNCTPSMPITNTMDIFMPIELFSNGDSSTSLDTNDKLVYRFNLTKLCGGVTFFPSFSTVTNIMSSKKINPQRQVSQRATLQSYPFDVYLAQLVMYSRNISESESSGKPVRITDSFGIAVNFEASLLDRLIVGGQSGTSEQLLVTLQIQRSIMTKIFVVVRRKGIMLTELQFLSTGITAVAFLTICAATIVYRSASIYSEMFVVPIGTLFAFTSIRANLPGAPSGFGTTIGESASVLGDTVHGLTRHLYSPTCAHNYVLLRKHSVGLLLTILYLRIRANGFESTAEGPAFGPKREGWMSATNCTNTAASFAQPTGQEEYYLHLEASAGSHAASLDQEMEGRSLTYRTV